MRQYIDHYGELSDRQKKVVQELHIVMKRAEDLLQECKCKKMKLWLFSALALTDIKEDVLEIELDLAWWTSMFDISSIDFATNSEEDNEVIKALEQLKTCYYKLSDERKSLQKAALRDKEHLQARLEEEMPRHTERSETHFLSVYLLSRLKASKGDSNILASEVEFIDKHFRSNLKWVRTLGSGSFGKVDEVTWLHQLKSRKWAMKTMFDDVERRPEAKFLKVGSHPHIVPYIWSWEQEDSENDQMFPRSLMELMPMDLSTLIKKQRKNRAGPPFEVHVAIDIMLQIVSATRYLHGERIEFDGKKSKITHRDLKPQKVLVEQLGTPWKVKLADFGISKVYHGTKTTSTQTSKQGIIVYAAPEVFLPREGTNEPNFPPKADVWSFAMTCSEIITGNIPFPGLPVGGLHSRIKEDGIRPDLPTDLPDFVRFCITSCWNIDPRQRPNFLNICRMLSLAKATSLEILPLDHRTRPLLKPSNLIWQTIALQITGEPHQDNEFENTAARHEVGEKYFLVETIFTNYTNTSMTEELVGSQATNHKTGNRAAEDQYKCLNPIQIPIMQGSFCARPANRYGHGCLFGVIVSSEYEAKLKEMNLKVVTGGYIGETNARTTEDVIHKHFWGEEPGAPGARLAAEFYATGYYGKRYVYTYFSYGFSKRNLISYCWQDNVIMINDRDKASSASTRRIVLGSKILTDFHRADEQHNYTVALAST